MKKIVHVAVGVIQRGEKILLAKRAEHQHQGGLWEFPGGKVERGELVTSALVRELSEELCITATEFCPLIQITHDYGDKSVLLDVWRVTAFEGNEQGREGQPLAWVARSELKNYAFPAANAPIVDAILLPSLVAITPPHIGYESLLAYANRAHELGARALQLRTPQLAHSEVWRLHRELQNRFGERLQILVNSRHLLHRTDTNSAAIDVLPQVPWSEIQGIHITAYHLSSLAELLVTKRQPLQGWLGHNEVTVTASCHNASELKLAEQLGVQAVLISPVAATSSHPDQTPLGWSVFADLVTQAKQPAYALGGMTINDLAQARKVYAQGIAGISLFSEP